MQAKIFSSFLLLLLANSKRTASGAIRILTWTGSAHLLYSDQIRSQDSSSQFFFQGQPTHHSVSHKKTLDATKWYDKRLSSNVNSCRSPLLTVYEPS